MISRRLPRAVATGDAQLAYDLAMQAQGDMLAERAAALLMDELTLERKEEIASGICADAPPRALAQLGALAFSFPLWRFVTQRTPRMDSLIEAAGYQRPTRDSDLRDASLPDPARDALGCGFMRESGGEYVEYRRAYLLYGSPNGALLIRNSSYFFGRDRLQHPFYVAPACVDMPTLMALTAGQIDNGEVFTPLRAVAGQQVAPLIAGLMRHENALHDWLWGEGLPATLDYLREKLAGRRGMPFVGMIEKGWPAWRPQRVVALDEGVIADIAQGVYAAPPSQRIALLSGPGGDFPL